jgi:hypothetical protein
MRFELTTSTLARWRSTTELRPRCETRARFLHALPRRASENLHQNFGAAGTIGKCDVPRRRSDARGGGFPALNGLLETGFRQ